MSRRRRSGRRAQTLALSTRRHAPRLRRAAQAEPSTGRLGAREARVALLSDATVTQIVPLLKVLFAHHGVRAEIHLGEYDSTELEVLNLQSALYAFRPDVVVILSRPTRCA
ncbi:MAG: hypothetical protein U0802_01425 [Candidatus Binatia bacterium]